MRYQPASISRSHVFTKVFALCSTLLCSLFIVGCSAQQPEPAAPASLLVPEQATPNQLTTPVPPTAQVTPAPTEEQATTQFPVASEHSNTALTYRIIDAPNGTFGYDILSDGRLFVHQTNLPGMPGSEGCKTKAEAEKLAAFVIEKIRKGEMPPSVTPEELKTLNIR